MFQNLKFTEILFVASSSNVANSIAISYHYRCLLIFLRYTLFNAYNSFQLIHIFYSSLLVDRKRRKTIDREPISRGRLSQGERTRRRKRFTWIAAAGRLIVSKRGKAAPPALPPFSPHGYHPYPRDARRSAFGIRVGRRGWPAGPRS